MSLGLRMRWVVWMMWLLWLRLCLRLLLWLCRKLLPR